MIPLLPQVLWHGVDELELPAGAAWLAAAERERAESLQFSKRRSDFLLGRFAAKSTVARALGLSASPSVWGRIEVRNRASGAERGAPELFLDGSPSPIEISVSDRAGWGVCVLQPRGLRVGCDLELVEERSDAFVSDYLTPKERAFVSAAAPGRPRWVRANAVWSAKESILKVLRTGLRRDTRSVEIHFPHGAESLGWLPLRASSAEGVAFTGWFRRFGEFLLTFAAEQPAAAPRALVLPERLADATPSHRWLSAPLADSATR